MGKGKENHWLHCLASCTQPDVYVEHIHTSGERSLITVQCLGFVLSLDWVMIQQVYQKRCSNVIQLNLNIN